MSDHERIQQLLPAYALAAVTAEEADEVQSHLDGCGACSDELGTLLEMAVALEGERTPPSGVWERIVREIDDRQALATVTDLSERRIGRGLSLLAGIAASAALVFAGFLVARLTDGDPLDEQAVVAAAENAARQKGSVVAEFVVEETTVAELVLTVDGKGFVIPNENLPTLDPSRTYQLWVINADAAVISAGVLGADPDPAPFTWTGEVTGLALTTEVAGGVVSSEGDVVSMVTDL